MKKTTLLAVAVTALLPAFAAAQETTLKVVSAFAENASM